MDVVGLRGDPMGAIGPSRGRVWTLCNWGDHGTLETTREGGAHEQARKRVPGGDLHARFQCVVPTEVGR